MQPSSPIVSVIVPNYNHAAYLPRRIESILGQHYAAIEVLLLDDCSRDASREIIQHYAAQDARIRYHFNSTNSGSVFKQWAAGIAQTTGKYIWIAESDDYADLDFLTTLVPLLEQDDALGFAYSDSLTVNEREEPLGKISALKEQIFASDHWNHDFVATGLDELAQYLSRQCTVNNASAVLFRRSSLEAAGGVDTSFRYTGDWLVYIKLSMRGNLAYVARCLNYYREHAANASKQSLANGAQLFERQKCFAYIYAQQVLSVPHTIVLLEQANQEYYNLLYLLLFKARQPGQLLGMLRQLWQISSAYCLRLQTNALRRKLRILLGR